MTDKEQKIEPEKTDDTPPGRKQGHEDSFRPPRPLRPPKSSHSSGTTNIESLKGYQSEKGYHRDFEP